MKHLLQAMKESLRDMLPQISPEGEIPLPPREREEDQEKTGEDDLIPILRIPSTLALRIFVKGNEDIINTYILKCLNRAIIKNLPEAVLFRVDETGLTSVISYEDYPIQIDMLREYFLKNEEYEKLSLCDKLLIKYNIDKLIKESV